MAALTIYFVTVVSFFFFFRRVISEVPRPIAITLSHMLGIECNLRNLVINLGVLALKIWGPKHANSDAILDNFSTTFLKRLHLGCKGHCPDKILSLLEGEDNLPTHSSSGEHLYVSGRTKI